MLFHNILCIISVEEEKTEKRDYSGDGRVMKLKTPSMLFLFPLDDYHLEIKQFHSFLTTTICILGLGRWFKGLEWMFCMGEFGVSTLAPHVPYPCPNWIPQKNTEHE